MKFKVVDKSLILTEYSHKIIEGENLFDTVEIAVPKSRDDCDLSTLSFSLTVTSEDGKNSAVQILKQTKCDEKYIYLKGTITSNFSAVTGNVTYMLTGINGDNIVAKFQSEPQTIINDISLNSLPNVTTAEQIYNQTRLEADRADEAAKRAEKASQTPAPAEIYPATTEQLGGVKVDGKTIIANSDGTISAPDSETLRKEIEDIKSIIMPASQPNNYLIYDNSGNPSIMVAIPKFYLDEVIDGASHTVHPAFIINGVEQDVIYISKYQNIVENDRAYSLPMKTPQTNVSFDQAWNYCKNKGAGWHLMTNAEWAAIMLWCKKNGTMPKGNNDYGKDISETDLPQKAITATHDSTGKINQILTGSGPESWYHNGTFAGIADLNGNTWEWYSGFRTVNLEIQILADNDAANCNNSVSANSTAWKAIMPDGTLTAPGTSGTIKYREPFRNKNFKNMSVTPAISENVSILLEALAIIPSPNSGSEVYDGAMVWVSSGNDAIPCRGGRWTPTAHSMLATDFDNVRTATYDRVGFRCAYYESR